MKQEKSYKKAFLICAIQNECAFPEEDIKLIRTCIETSPETDLTVVIPELSENGEMALSSMKTLSDLGLLDPNEKENASITIEAADKRFEEIQGKAQPINELMKEAKPEKSAKEIIREFDKVQEELNNLAKKLGKENNGHI
ncbi:MAG: hypothetical protein JXA43_01890 [Candidatus Diapherotrites archaeon]|nr:hypothetical protein [Candidatus Diapherotrites archaeon]